MDIKREEVSKSSIREGKYILIDGRPFEIVGADWSAPGKHGHAKIRFVAIELLTDKKHDVVLPAHDNVEIPLIEKKTAQVLSIVDAKANVMDSETFETFDLDIPDDLKDVITEGCQVLYHNILGQKVMKQLKSAA